jgi:hypothetical protein
MEEKKFLDYLKSNQKLTSEQADRCWEESVSKKQSFSESLVLKGYFTTEVLKQHLLDFNATLQLKKTQTEEELFRKFFSDSA